MNIKTVISAVLLATLVASPALAQSSYGRPYLHRGGVTDEAHRQHPNEAYLKAVSNENDRLIGKIKGICRGC
jgi:hypothetical protein